MDKRLKELRKTLDITQQEFADRIGIKRNGIAKYETGVASPSAAVISLICREFNVNEEWLRTGKGEMFLPPKDEIGDLVGRLVSDQSAEFNGIILDIMRSLDKLDDKGKALFCKTVQDMAERIVKRKKEDD